MPTDSGSLNWESLLPQEWSKWKWPPEDLRDLTDYWVFGIVVIAAVLLLWAGWRTLEVWQRTRKYRNLAKRLLSSEELSQKRSEWSRRKGYNLAADFNDMLVEVPRLGAPLEKELKRCGSASEVFNTSSMGQGIVGSRLLMATPAILTGLGVLGTFVGLAMGIGKLDLDSKNIEDLDKSISPLIKGSSTAFVTSVWGVACSILFTLFEKILEWYAVGRIRKVQLAFDSLVPRYTPEESMIALQRSSTGQEEILKGLAVAIGDEMQRAMDRIGDGITTAVRDALGGQAQDLGKMSAELMSKALTAELGNLQQAITGISDGFQKEFGAASQQLSTAIAGFDKVLSGVDDTVKSSREAMTQAVERLTAHEGVVKGLEDGAIRLKEAATELNSMRDTFNQSAMRNAEAASAQERAAAVNEVVADKFQLVGEKLPELQASVADGARMIASLGQPLMDLKDLLGKTPEAFGGQLNTTLAGFEAVIKGVDDMVRSSRDAMNQAVERLTAHEDVVKGLEEGATRLKEAATELVSMRETFSISAAKNLEAAAAQEKAATKNELVSDKLETIGEKLPEVQEAITSGAQIIGSLGQPLLDLKDILSKTPEIFGQQADEQATRDEKRSSLLLLQTENLAKAVGEAAEKFGRIETLSTSLSTSSANLEKAGAALGDLARSISSASENHATAAKASEKAALAGQRAAEKLEPIPQSLTGLSSTLELASGKIKEGADSAKAVYGQLIEHQKQWFDGVKIGLEAMRDRVQQILDQYGSAVDGRTQDQMDMWTNAVNESLGKFAVQVQTLEGAINDLTSEMNN
jgi:methyl-accepting chemotaxis protein